jgi:CBS domain-containing protein
MRIATLLSDKGTSVATIPGEATVADAVAELGRQGVGALVVSPDGVRIEGIVSERDVVRSLAHGDARLLGQAVSTIMSTEVQTCGLDDDTERLMRLMTERRIRHVPVVDESSLCGIVSIGDVVKVRIAELESDAKELVEYINGR